MLILLGGNCNKPFSHGEMNAVCRSEMQYAEVSLPKLMSPKWQVAAFLPQPPSLHTCPPTSPTGLQTHGQRASWASLVGF